MGTGTEATGRETQEKVGWPRQSQGPSEVAGPTLAGRVQEGSWPSLSPCSEVGKNLGLESRGLVVNNMNKGWRDRQESSASVMAGRRCPRFQLCKRSRQMGWAPDCPSCRGQCQLWVEGMCRLIGVCWSSGGSAPTGLIRDRDPVQS